MDYESICNNKKSVQKTARTCNKGKFGPLQARQTFLSYKKAITSLVTAS